MGGQDCEVDNEGDPNEEDEVYGDDIDDDDEDEDEEGETIGGWSGKAKVRWNHSWKHKVNNTLGYMNIKWMSLQYTKNISEKIQIIFFSFEPCPQLSSTVSSHDRLEQDHFER